MLMERPADSHSRSWLRRRDLLRGEMGVVAAFHLIVGVVIVAAPRERIVTPGTADIFGTIPLHAWAVWFVVTGLAAAATVVRVTPLRLWGTWLGAFPIGAGWIYGFAVAVSDGRGNAVFAIVWPFLLIWWAFTALRMYLGGTEAWWGGR